MHSVWLRKFGRWLTAGSLVGLVAITDWTVARASPVRYLATFDSTWSAATHPLEIPSNPHFSRLVGATHNDQVQFWKPGELASLGIERMAERGATNTLLEEFAPALATGNALQSFTGPGIEISPGSAEVTLQVDAAHPLVTLVSMIAPSPDWFVGVHDQSLLQGGRWVESLVVELWPYDSGTDDGVTYAAPDIEPAVHQPIRQLTTGPFAGTGPLGTFTFTLLKPSLPGDANGDGKVELADFVALRNNFGKHTLNASEAGDFDQNGTVDLADFVILRNGFSAPTTQAVPEPSTFVLTMLSTLLGGWFRRLRRA